MTTPTPAEPLLASVRELILAARSQVARTVNSSLTLLYWQVGQRVRVDVLKGKRAGYGLEILPTLSARLVPEFGNGFSSRNLARMISFAERFSEPAVAARLAERLGWSHVVEILALTDHLAQEFYAEMARAENWSVRTLRQQISSQLFLRTSYSRKSESDARQKLARLRETEPPSPDLVFRDPYVLRFLGLQDTLAERDMEAAIIRDMEAFILELGAGFAFLERQKRMIVGGVDHYLDLLFFHRKLRRLVAIELKLGAFTPGDKGQMELYLAWLKENEQGPDEKTPLGLILCARKNEETVRLLGLDRGDIRVASYIAAALPEATLRERLQSAVDRHLQNRDSGDSITSDCRDGSPPPKSLCG